MKLSTTLSCLAAILFASLFAGLVAVAAPDDETVRPNLDQVKRLEGTWLMVDESGQVTDEIGSVFEITAAGSVVLERMFAGTDHEMITMYHMDGKDLVLTHYCALGNQPRMRASTGSSQNLIAFAFDGGSNVDPERDQHMHEASISWVDDDRIMTTWRMYENGEEAHSATFDLARKK